MADKLRCVSTKKSINVSQDYETSPAPVVDAQRPVRTSSDKSNASLIFSQTRSATSQTEATTTSAMKGPKLKAPSAKQGSALQALKARRSLSATQEADNNDSAEQPVQEKAIGSADPASKPVITDDPVNKQGQRQSLRLLQKDEGSELRPAGSSHDGEPREQEVAEQSEKQQKSSNVLQPGSTQDNAIDLSDDNESSPPPEPSPVVQQAPPVPKAAPPKTPAVKSSPPNAAEWNNAGDAELFGMAERSTRKANIINFSKSGPRNQGVSKHRTPRPRGAKGAPSSRHGRSSGSPLKKRYLKKEKESATETGTQHCAGAAQPKSSNVAENLSQAMRELYDKPSKYTEPMVVDSKELQRAAVPVQAAGGPSKSQVSIKASKPSPPIPTTVVANSLPQDDHDYEGDTLIDYNAPGDKVAFPIHTIGKLVPAVIADGAAPVEAAEKPRLKGSAPAVIADVAAPVEAAEKPRLKRSAPAAAEPPKRAKKQIKPADLGIVEEPPRTLAVGTALVPRGDDRKQTHARRLVGRPIRNVSQGSQTVDLNGSPVPQGMEMQNNTEAVLDFYSRQTLGESGEPTGRGHDTPGVDDAVDYSGDGNAYTAPLSHHPERPHLMSSNTKAVPASPRAESTALTSFKASPTLSRKMLEKRDSIGGLHDPFTKTKVQEEDPVVSHMTTLEGVLSRHPYQNLTRQPRDTIVAPSLPDAEDDDAGSNTEREDEADVPSVQMPKVEASLNRKTAGTRFSATTAHVEPLPASLMPSMPLPPRPPRKKLLEPAKAATPFLGRSLARELDRQIHDFGGSASAVAEEEQSLGATLVAHEDAMSERFGRTRKISRPPAALSRATTREPQGSNDAEEWALTLKPRQLSLVNQMVECVQQLTQYMFDQERGTEEMLEEYHRRNLYLIEQEEKQQVKKYHQMQRDLVLRKKDKLDEAEVYHRNLVRRFEEFEREASRYERRKAGWEAVNEEIEAFIMDHS
ncbi:hypothetical protein CKM354_001280700 [Cercospora kikuchii]|uniref:Uncharacterized protein n=1 Tax=Cercospora kikuchii TaxID=84275 RepID=A0A9P3L243_9PEZI|nr:uncharacterized protein CKM354_001280700 [Cercospora kikuchii]GIZ49780.1 hypothetical protein CKM354_001280700 [Cercospora kikuchii]